MKTTIIVLSISIVLCIVVMIVLNDISGIWDPYAGANHRTKEQQVLDEENFVKNLPQIDARLDLYPKIYRTNIQEWSLRDKQIITFDGQYSLLILLEVWNSWGNVFIEPVIIGKVVGNILYVWNTNPNDIDKVDNFIDKHGNTIKDNFTLDFDKEQKDILSLSDLQLIYEKYSFDTIPK